MNQLPPIAQIGEPLLRQQAQPITDRGRRSTASPAFSRRGTVDLQQPQLAELIESLIARAIASKGVGIAAPQIFQSIRLFIIASHPSERYPQAPLMEPTAMINPRILSWGEEIVKDWEGCLSVPNTRGLVPRYRSIEVEYMTIEGVLKQEILTDFVARIFQHELDHLDGILFIDRITDSGDLYTEAEYRQLIAHK